MYSFIVSKYSKICTVVIPGGGKGRSYLYLRLPSCKHFRDGKYSPLLPPYSYTTSPLKYLYESESYWFDAIGIFFLIYASVRVVLGNLIKYTVFSSIRYRQTFRNRLYFKIVGKQYDTCNKSITYYMIMHFVVECFPCKSK